VLNVKYNRSYYKNCYIEGAVDAIWGFGKAVFENCTLNQIKVGGAYTAGGTETCYFLFDQCTFTAVSNVDVIVAIEKAGKDTVNCKTISNVMFGCTWYPDLHVYIKNSVVTAPLNPTAWSNNCI